MFNSILLLMKKIYGWWGEADRELGGTMNLFG